ncbi:MAG: hypothetical protein J1D87_07240 [Lachnospiraceae bacterium]|nr:hypothetical protein [Lachnospiraceae bacterium]
MIQKKKRSLLVTLALMILLGGLLHKDTVMTVRANPGSAFSIEAEMMPSNKETYDVRLTVENQGEDWEGAVRLIVEEDYRKPVAYDTALSLPQGSKKQFVVKVPVNSVDNPNGTVIVTLLNKKGEEIAKKEFKRLLVEQMESLSMGILSDAYSQLTYLDMGGGEIYFYDKLYPIKLVELQQGNLEEMLDTLTILVIDHYNTGILTKKELQAIELWNMAGGVLIIGTGEYAEDTLKSFGGNYLGISYFGIQTPEEMPENDSETDSETEQETYYGSKYVDWSQITIAQLQGVGNLFSDYYTQSYAGSMGSGSVCVLPYSLIQIGSVGDAFLGYSQKDFVMQLLENASNYASSRYSSYSSDYNSFSYYTSRVLGMLGNSNSILNFGILKAIVIIYVIFVGPILYLILRFIKRRELYWIAVPVTAVLVIGLVFLAGRGFEVVNTRVYSVTVKDLAENGKSVTYMHCYDADRKEWDIRLAEGCEFAGPLSTSSYYSGLEDAPYYYHIKKEGDIFSIGINPGSNFEDSYFYIKNTKDKDAVKGGLTSQDVYVDGRGISGTISNKTNKDLDYFAVICNDSVYVFENLPAGASCNLQDKSIFGSSGSYYSSYIYNFLEDLYEDKEYEKISALSALGVGLCDVYPQSDPSVFIVIGVVKDWDKAANDNCSEVSYGCLYSVQ